MASKIDEHDLVVAEKKKRPHTQKWKEDYKKSYPCFTKSVKGEIYALCTLCKKHVSLASEGAHVLEKHTKSKQHADLAKAVATTPKIAMSMSTSSDKDLVTRAELLFTEFIIEHNLPIAAADHAGPLFRRMFPDSSTAKKYGCARTKTTTLIGELAKNDQKRMATLLKTKPYSLSTDGSNDVDDLKLYPIVVRYFDPDMEKVMCTMLSVPECKSAGTGENIFKLIDAELQKFGVLWDNCLCFSADNAAVMSGLNKGVIAFIRNKNQHVYFQGCPCHLIHLAASKAAACFPIQLEDLLVDIIYFLDGSAKRKQAFQEKQKEIGVSMKKLIKHVSTRWLSLEASICRILENYEPLTNFFKDELKNECIPKALSSLKAKRKATDVDFLFPSNSTAKKKSFGASSSSSLNPARSDSVSSGSKTVSHKSSTSAGISGIPCTSGSKSTSSASTSGSQRSGKSGPKSATSKSLSSSSSMSKQSRLERIVGYLVLPETKLYMLFLKFILPTFTTPNKALQQDAPCIHKVHTILFDLFRSTVTKFVSPTHTPAGEAVLWIDFYDSTKHRKDDDVMVGEEARAFLKTERIAKDTFIDSVKAFYITAVEYMRDKFPLTDLTLKHATVADVKKRKTVSYSSVKYFVEHFPCLNQTDVKDYRNKLEAEFGDYQIQEFDEGLLSMERPDKTWVEIGKIIDTTTGGKKFHHLSQLMLSILKFFHSNADCERAFSLVTKTKTKFRSSLNTTTMSNILVHKLMMDALGVVCHQVQHDPAVISRTKTD